MNKLLVALLTLLVNVSGALAFFHAFPEGTPLYIACGVIGMVSLNMLAFLGQPLLTPKPGIVDPELKLVPPPKGPPTALLVILFAGVGLLAGCATARNTAKLIEGQAARALGETAVSFAGYDSRHQQDIVDHTPAGQATKKLQEYQDKIQAPIRRAFMAVLFALKSLDDAIAAYDAGKAQDWPKLTGDVLKGVKDLADAIKAAGVPIKLPTLGGK
jgi:hypothetical protein